MIKRIHARICIMLFVAGAVLLLLGSIVNYSVNEKLGIVILWVAGALPVASVILSIIFLRCKNCGLSAARWQWSSNREYYCSRCGEQFKYDK